ncbi:MAG TPA: DUF2804 domain-containing protein [bacterium]|nr:DUF2804 domain-containing protein [bacterium]
MTQHEITEAGMLLDDAGRLTARGYSKRPVLTYNPENVRRFPWPWANRLRLKEWDYYGTTTPDYFFSCCVSHVGYIGLVFVYYIDFRNNRLLDGIHVTPLGKGCALPVSSETGDVEFRAGKLWMQFVREPERRILKVHWPKLRRAGDLDAELIVHQPRTLDSIVMATPMDDTCFYYNHKVNVMPTEGRLSIGNWQFDLRRDQALTTMDWGRGVWPYRTFWVWASLSGFLPDGRSVGWNLGRGFGDLSAATENCFYIDGRMTKLGWVDITYDAADHMKPWRMIADDGRLDLTFTPFLNHRSRAPLLVLDTKGNQMFGRYRGTLTDDQGVTYQIDDLIGWAEDHTARW